MDIDTFWNTAITLTGLGGIACFFIYSLYKEWLKLPIFPKLTKDQAFKLLRLFLILTFLFAIAALITDSIDKDHVPDREQTATEQAPLEQTTVEQTINCGPAVNDTEGNVTITGDFDC